MAHDGYNASTAARAVGYESPSQFSREFKRVLVQFPINGCSFGKMILWVLCRQNLRPKRSNGHCFFGQQSEVELVFLDLLC